MVVDTAKIESITGGSWFVEQWTYSTRDEIGSSGGFSSNSHEHEFRKIEQAMTQLNRYRRRICLVQVNLRSPHMLVALKCISNQPQQCGR